MAHTRNVSKVPPTRLLTHFLFLLAFCLSGDFRILSFFQADDNIYKLLCNKTQTNYFPALLTEAFLSGFCLACPCLP